MTFTKTLRSYDIQDASGNKIGYMGRYSGWYCVLFGVSDIMNFPGLNFNQAKSAIRSALA